MAYEKPSVLLTIPAIDVVHGKTGADSDSELSNAAYDVDE